MLHISPNLLLSENNDFSQFCFFSMFFNKTNPKNISFPEIFQKLLQILATSLNLFSRWRYANIKLPRKYHQIIHGTLIKEPTISIYSEYIY